MDDQEPSQNTPGLGSAGVINALQAVNELFYVFPSEGEFQYWNDALATVTGYSDEAIAAMEPSEFFVADDRADIVNAISRALDDEYVRVEATLQTKDGDRIPHEFSAVSFTHNSTELIAGVGRDITERKQREEELQQVEAKLRTQTNFATVLNRVLRHNLRNDITVIRGHIERIADQLDDESTVEIVLSHIDNLIDLSQKARELEEVISASTERRHIEMGALIEDVVESIEQEYPAASISVDYDDEIHVDVLQSFDRAVEELIDNAVKHSGESPTVTVVVDRLPNAVEIQISDDGPGLADIETEVFETGAETPLAHGTGVGLWMVHWIVSSHGGSIDSVVTENGTTLTITLPRKPAGGGQQQLTELTRSLDKYKAAFEEATDAIAIVNDDDRIMEANPGTETVFGVDPMELVGRSLTEFLPDEFEFDSEWQDFQQTGSKSDTVTVMDADGEERVLEYSAIADIIPGQHLFTSRDITNLTEQEQELSKSKQRYEALLEAAPDPVFVADAEAGELIEVNNAAERLVGKPRDQIVGQDLTTLHPAEDTELYRDAFNQITEEQTTVRRLPDGSRPKLVSADDETIPLEISIGTVSLPDGTVTYGIFRDISERVERE